MISFVNIDNVIWRLDSNSKISMIFVLKNVGGNGDLSLLKSLIHVLNNAKIVSVNSLINLELFFIAAE